MYIGIEVGRRGSQLLMSAQRAALEPGVGKIDRARDIDDQGCCGSFQSFFEYHASVATTDGVASGTPVPQS